MQKKRAWQVAANTCLLKPLRGHTPTTTQMSQLSQYLDLFIDKKIQIPEK